jgi:hypothetical protein
MRSVSAASLAAVANLGCIADAYLPAESMVLCGVGIVALVPTTAPLLSRRGRE